MDAPGAGDLLLRAQALEAEAAALRARAAGSGAVRTRSEFAILDGATQVAVIVIDPAGHVTAWNAGAAHLLGWNAEAMRGRPIADLFTPEDRAEGCPEQTLRIALERGRAEETGWRLRADGERRRISGETLALRDTSGDLAGFATILHDRTDLYEAEQALRASDERYRTLFEAIDDGFCVITFLDGPHGPLSDYIHVEANPGYERHTGIAGIVGRTLRDLVPPDDAEAWLALYGGVLRTGTPIRFERYFALVDRTIEVSAVRIEPLSRRQVSVLFRDITARRKAEDALRASEALARTNSERVQLALAAGAIIGTWLWDLPSDRFTVDEAFAKSFGL
ncbi:MAG: PAS domain S-box protein, partial [Actinomycetospora chiangmaiensis]|nr:PAS domain S-box protein [Actinomycetospora chiangmaiensis]